MSRFATWRFSLAIAVMMLVTHSSLAQRNLSIVQSAPASEGKRVALVIGNSAYRHSAALPNPKNDAQAIGTALRNLGFDTDVRIDQTKAQMDDALRRFGDRLDGAKAAVFFYAGHGMQIDGKNFLLPVDARLAKERDINYETIDVGMVLKEMEATRRVNLVFLDACRDNPLARSLARSLSRSSAVGRGLAPVDAATGTLISYATKDGATAADGEGRNSPYTTALLKHIQQPGVEVGLMLRRVRESVLESTGEKQVPWEYGSLLGEFYFKPGEATASPIPIAATSINDETVFWQSIAQSGNAEDFESYLKQYPKGKFERLARSRLKAAKPAAGPTTITAAQAKPAPLPEDGEALLKMAMAAETAGDHSRGFDLYSRAADKGESAADLAIAKLLILGQGVARDLAEAGKRLEKAAAAGNADAEYLLAVATLSESSVHMFPNQYGPGSYEAKRHHVTNLFNRAADHGSVLAQARHCATGSGESQKFWCKKAAEQGHTGAQCRLAILGATGSQGIMAISLLRPPAEKAEMACQFELAKILERGTLETIDYRQAWDFYIRAAQRGNLEARKALVRLKKFGNGRNPEEIAAESSAFWSRAEQGDTEAQLALGVVLQSGLLKMPAGQTDMGAWYKKNQEKGLAWIRRAAVAGNHEAQLFLAGWPYALAGQVDTVAERAAWLIKAAEGGHLEAQLQLIYQLTGVSNTWGPSISADQAKADAWTRRAAEGGLAESQHALGHRLYYENQYAVAADWYRKAAEQGHSLSQSLLVLQYKSGTGVSKDLTEAYFWRSVSISNDDPFAEPELLYFAANLKPEQLAKARKRFLDWRAPLP